MYCIYQDTGGEDSTGKTEDSQDQDDSDVEVTEDLEGNLEDTNESSQQDKSSSEDEGWTIEDNSYYHNSLLRICRRQREKRGCSNG